MKNPRTALSAGAVILALAGLALTATTLRPSQQAVSASQAAAAAKPIVETKVIHRTVRITRHQKPKKASVSNTQRSAPAPVAQQVVIRRVATAPAPARSGEREDAYEHEESDDGSGGGEPNDD